MTLFDEPVFTSNEVGSRYATKVKVKAEGVFSGRRGVVARVDHPGSILVRLAHHPWQNLHAASGPEVPFADSELERID